MAELDTIIVKAPAGTKARWVRQSQRAGRKLSDWIVDQIEVAMHQKTMPVIIPTDLSFSDLKMARDPQTGDASFDWAPIKRICDASGVHIDFLRAGPEDRLASLLTTWYRYHLAAGGLPDPVYADLISEAALEDLHGHGISHTPGRA